MIIGTAGHIDHGKSTLVTALTGKPMDRLAEERRREITIELNFAPLELGGGRTVGVVDVPGHEDFIRTMVAGASGIDLVLLVVAADEGIMPQTEEHLSILEHLNVSAGIPVITKADLVEPDWLELVRLELAERTEASTIDFERPIPVSARTGEGISELRERIAARADALIVKHPADAFRMPIDRVFSLQGVGSVVTGTAWSGRVGIGESVTILPSGAEGRVRSIETHGSRVERSEPRARTAIALGGIDRSSLSRGDVLVTEELPWAPTTAIDVQIDLDRRAPRSLRSRTRIRLHLGTAEVLARVLPRFPIQPGQSGIARLRLESPTVARGEDRFVIRSYSPVTTIGGGRVLDPLPPRRRALWPDGLDSTSQAERFRAVLARRPDGVSSGTLPILLGLPPAQADAIAHKEPSARQLGNHWVTTAAVEALGSRFLDELREYHRKHISEPGMPLETLRHSARVQDAVIEAALADLARAGRLRRIDGLVALAGFAPRVAGGEAEIERVVRILQDASLTPPSVGELERSTGRRDLHALLRLAAASGRVEAVERDRYYAREALDRFTSVLSDMGREGQIVPATLRDRLGISRKYLIPLLEWADGKGITVRVGEGRRLRAGLGQSP
jgi:selenocysteine-specific elongation factor